jgi:hypothetical protein
MHRVASALLRRGGGGGGGGGGGAAGASGGAAQQEQAWAAPPAPPGGAAAAAAAAAALPAATATVIPDNLSSLSKSTQVGLAVIAAWPPHAPCWPPPAPAHLAPPIPHLNPPAPERQHAPGAAGGGAAAALRQPRRCDGGLRGGAVQAGPGAESQRPRQGAPRGGPAPGQAHPSPALPSTPAPPKTPGGARASARCATFCACRGGPTCSSSTTPGPTLTTRSCARPSGLTSSRSGATCTGGGAAAARPRGGPAPLSRAHSLHSGSEPLTAAAAAAPPPPLRQPLCLPRPPHPHPVARQAAADAQHGRGCPPGGQRGGGRGGGTRGGGKPLIPLSNGRRQGAPAPRRRALPLPASGATPNPVTPTPVAPPQCPPPQAHHPRETVHARPHLCPRGGYPDDPAHVLHPRAAADAAAEPHLRCAPVRPWKGPRLGLHMAVRQPGSVRSPPAPAP